MKKFKMSYIVLAILVLTLMLPKSFVVLATDNKTINISYSNKTPYDYPVKPGSDAWKNFKTHTEMVKACMIPDNILKNMTTDALTKTVMDYPLMIDMLALPTQYDGYQGIYCLFNGLQELASRKDAVISLNNYKNNTPSSSSLVAETNGNLKSIFADALISGITLSRNNTIPKMSSGVVPLATSTYVYTPNRTAVAALYNKTWSDAMNTEAQLIAGQNQFSITYPAATRLRGYNIKYNCHSYAWYNTSSTNLYWIDNPISYMTDGSYRSSSAVAGAKVFYDSALGQMFDHSAIAYNTPAGGSFDVTSKWGESGLYQHALMYCPYADYSPTCSFYVR